MCAEDFSTLWGTFGHPQNSFLCRSARWEKKRKNIAWGQRGCFRRTLPFDLNSGQTTIWLCCKSMLRFQRPPPWPAQVINYAAKGSRRARCWEVSLQDCSWRSPKFVRLMKQSLRMWPWGVVSPPSQQPACFVCKNPRSEVSLGGEGEIYRWNYGTRAVKANKKGDIWLSTSHTHTHTHTHTLLAWKARQTCLGALRYDDAAAKRLNRHDDSHTPAVVPSGNQPAAAEVVHKKTLLSEASQVLAHSHHACLKQECEENMSTHTHKHSTVWTNTRGE